jgi:trehalose synthase
MRIADTADLWWKNAVIYCADIETYYDTDHDGTGDIAGLAQRLDYLDELGINCLWLMPFYPSPDLDDGYDITDFYGVDSRLGSLGDLVELIRTAHSRGIRVIADLVVNHTSDQHPWFKAARESLDNPFRDYYIWRADEPPDTSAVVVFHGEQKAIWTKDDATGQWYLHRFYAHQPDLNLGNPKVRDEIAKVLGFWLQLGLDGFRVDAVPQLLTVGLHDDIEASFTDPHGYLRALRSFMSRRTGDAILLGEVNLPYQQQAPLFGGDTGDELTMMFDFVAMQNLYLSLARADGGPLIRAVQNRPPKPPDAQWVSFVRNHDELTLDQLSEPERQEVFAAFGPEPEMQVFGRGIKRRLPPMLGGDQQRIRMVYSLQFSLPGSPALLYGEEVGMGEDAAGKGRMAVRTPMQWTSGVNGGFSNADSAALPSKLVEGEYGPEKVNVADAKRDPESLLNFMIFLIRRYRECPELAWGEFSVLDQPFRQVIAHRSTWVDSSVIAVHNLGKDPVTVPLTIAGEQEGSTLLDLLHDGTTTIGDGGTVELELGGYGFRWLRLHRKDDGIDRLPNVSTVDVRPNRKK